MTDDTIRRLRKVLSESPILGAESTPTIDEIDLAASELGVPFARDYQEFLLLFGGAMIGAYPVFGLRPVEVMGDDHWSVIEVTRHYREMRLPEIGRWVVFSEDHAGNPIGFDALGTVWIFDHDFGGVSKIASTFEEYIRDRCLTTC